MKELSIEEKAKAYDEAIKYGQYLINERCKEGTDGSFHRSDLQKMFPELKESEDERIRKHIIQVLKDNFSGEDTNKCIAWLEKQGEQKFEQKFFINDKVVHKATGKIWTIHHYLKDTNSYYVEDNDGLLHHYTESELKLVEQKPTDKVEPKFKEGDWVVVDDGRTGRIIECTKDYADVDLEFSCLSTRVNNIHFWTIQDAKDGDVLISSGNVKYSNGIKYERIYLFNNFDNAYFTLTKFSNHVEEYDINVNVDYPDNTVPATKEQKEILFMVMKEAGYEWDAEKKELKKIEQKPADLPNGKDYGIDGLYAAIDILQKTLGKVEGYQTDDGILEHECAISAVKELSKHKPAWDEEDEKMIQDIINDIAIAQEQVYCKSRCEDEINWLKSLKDRVLPQPKPEWSEEDEYNTAFIIETLLGLDGDKEYLAKCKKMAKWLKSLRPQNWTKEDKERYISCLQRLSTGNPEQPETINSKWFKEHVYPQKQWKPSDEQIEAINTAINVVGKGTLSGKQLIELQEQLIKLRGE